MFSRLRQLTGRLPALNWKYFLSEVLLIIIGINVGLWFNGLSTDRRDRQLEAEVLQEMVLSLEEDAASIRATVAIHDTAIQSCNFLLQPLDSLRQTPGRASLSLVNAWASPISVLDYTSYESLKNYGLRLVRDPDLRRDIIRLYGRHYGAAKTAEEFHRVRARDFDNIMRSLYGYADGRYFFKSQDLQPIVDQAYRIKGLQNSHYYAARVYTETVLPALDSLLIDLADHLE